ncbi:MAG TPA: hypothetical protein VLF87_03480 [Patescibacteria group bacterium]|nr:hypothetical protein [Patescibacteria group bacterium]HSX48096.1 hypothetical protein [Candidatus Nanoarchaeia archaeon]
MDLQPLRHDGDVSARQFDLLFRARLGSLYGRALAILHALGPMHSFSVANCIHLGLQKDISETIIARLDKWADQARNTTTRRRLDVDQAISFDVDTKIFVDLVYAEYFMEDMVIPSMFSRLILPPSVTTPR